MLHEDQVCVSNHTGSITVSNHQPFISDNEVVLMDRCQVTDEFSANAFKPSGDGSFGFHLENDRDTLDRSKVAKLLVELIGSGVHIPDN